MVSSKPIYKPSNTGSRLPSNGINKPFRDFHLDGQVLA